MKRPAGVTILALLLFANGAAHGIQAVALYSRPWIAAGPTNAHLQHIFPDEHTVAMSMLAAVVPLVLGAGIWFLDRLAWWYLVVYSGIDLVFGLLCATTGALMAHPSHIGKYSGSGFGSR